MADRDVVGVEAVTVALLGTVAGGREVGDGVAQRGSGTGA